MYNYKFNILLITIALYGFNTITMDSPKPDNSVEYSAKQNVIIATRRINCDYPVIITVKKNLATGEHHSTMHSLDGKRLKNPLIRIPTVAFGLYCKIAAFEQTLKK